MAALQTTTAETFKNWTEAFAWACAEGFFVYKTFSGYVISNLSLSLKCHRKHSEPGKDFLVVTANLKKGDRGAVSLHDVRACVSSATGKLETKILAGSRRLSSTKAGAQGVFRLRESEAKDVPLLNLPPGEETMFFNAERGRVEDLLAAGVLDPARPIEFSVRVALSRARFVLQTVSWDLRERNES
jgi:hypothetical protein